VAGRRATQTGHDGTTWFHATASPSRRPLSKRRALHLFQWVEIESRDDMDIGTAGTASGIGAIRCCAAFRELGISVPDQGNAFDDFRESR
jgi:hypothetical protein